MDEVSIGPDPKNANPEQNDVDAHSATERDIDCGLAGAEAKPFSSSPVNRSKNADKPAANSGEKPAPLDADANLISDRRNAGRE